jgi:hypothetical protein
LPRPSFSCSRRGDSFARSTSCGAFGSADTSEGRLGERYTASRSGPPAPRILVVQTSLPREREIEEKADPEGYFAGGYLDTLMRLETAERFGFDLS